MDTNVYFKTSINIEDKESKFIKIPEINNEVISILKKKYNNISTNRIYDAIIFSSYIMDLYKTNYNEDLVREINKSKTYLRVYTKKVKESMKINLKKYYTMFNDSVEMELLDVEYDNKNNPKIYIENSIMYKKIYSEEKEVLRYNKLPIKCISSLDSKTCYLLSQILKKVGTMNSMSFSNNISEDNNYNYVMLKFDDLVHGINKNNRNRDLKRIIKKLKDKHLATMIEGDVLVVDEDLDYLRSLDKIVYQIDSHTIIAANECYLNDSGLTLKECIELDEVNIIKVKK